MTALPSPAAAATTTTELPATVVWRVGGEGHRTGGLDSEGFFNGEGTCRLSWVIRFPSDPGAENYVLTWTEGPAGEEESRRSEGPESSYPGQFPSPPNPPYYDPTFGVPQGTLELLGYGVEGIWGFEPKGGEWTELCTKKRAYYEGNFTPEHVKIDATTTTSVAAEVTLSAGPPVPEPAAGETAAESFTVSLAQAPEAPVSITYVTEDGTASAARHEYEPVTGTLTFEPGKPLSQQISVGVDDGSGQAATPTLSFKLELLSASGVKIDPNSNTATATILVPSISGQILSSPESGSKPIANAAVALTGTASSGDQVTRETTTSESGNYSFNVDPGTYAITPEPISAGYHATQCPGGATAGSECSFTLGSGVAAIASFYASQAPPPGNRACMQSSISGLRCVGSNAKTKAKLASLEYERAAADARESIEGLECSHSGASSEVTFACVGAQLLLSYDNGQAAKQREISADPPDPNFGILARPKKAPARRLPGRRFKAFNGFAAELVKIGALQRALVSSVDRQSAAIEAGNVADARNQASAIGRYAHRIAKLAHEAAKLAPPASAELTHLRLSRRSRSALHGTFAPLLAANHRLAAEMGEIASR